MALNHYEVLGVARDVLPEEIFEAYRRLGPLCHPDVAIYDMMQFPVTTLTHDECWKAVSQAFAVLSHLTRRAMYDAGDESTLDWGDDFLATYNAIIGDFHAPKGLRNGPIAPVPVVSLVRVVNTYVELQSLFHGEMMSVTYSRIVSNGPRVVTYNQTVHFSVWPGMHLDGYYLVPGLGHQIGDECGVLKLHIHLNQHPVFKCVGSDLYMNLYVPLETAVVGGLVKVYGFDGKELTIFLSEPFPDHPPLVKRIEGEGMPFPGGRGCLVVSVYVQVPFCTNHYANNEFRRILNRMRFNHRKYRE